MYIQGYIIWVIYAQYCDIRQWRTGYTMADYDRL